MPNHQLAETAETVAAVLAEDEFPAIAALQVCSGPEVHRASAVLQLACGDNELRNLLACVEQLDDDKIEIMIKRCERAGLAYTSVQINGQTASVPFTVWTHLPDSETSALWGVLDQVPEPNEWTPLTVELLSRAASKIDAFRSVAEEALA